MAAEALVKLGSGSNLQGYYMYHGGADPVGHFTLTESRATGYLNDMEINYDFQAPLGQYGQPRPSRDRPAPATPLLADYGTRSRPCPPWSTSGRRAWMTGTGAASRTDQRLHLRQQLPAPSRSAARPRRRPVPVAGDGTGDGADQLHHDFAGLVYSWPVNLPIGGAILTYSTVQPRLVGDSFIFFALAGTAPSSPSIPARRPRGPRAASATSRRAPTAVSSCPAATAGKARIIVLTRRKSARRGGRDLGRRPALPPRRPLLDGDTLRVQSRQPAMAFSALLPPLAITGTDDGLFGHFEVSAAPHPVKVELRRIASPGIVPPVRTDARGAFAPDEATFASAAGAWQISSPRDSRRAYEVFLRIDYAGDIGRPWIGDRLVDDDFYFRPALGDRALPFRPRGPREGPHRKDPAAPAGRPDLPAQGPLAGLRCERPGRGNPGRHGRAAYEVAVSGALRRSDGRGGRAERSGSPRRRSSPRPALPPRRARQALAGLSPSPAKFGARNPPTAPIELISAIPPAALRPESRPPERSRRSAGRR